MKVLQVDFENRCLVGKHEENSFTFKQLEAILNRPSSMSLDYFTMPRKEEIELAFRVKAEYHQKAVFGPNGMFLYNE